MSADNEENVGTNYILPTGDSLPELLAQLDEICGKLYAIWLQDKTTAKKIGWGDISKARLTLLGMIWQNIDNLITVANLKDLRRKKAE